MRRPKRRAGRAARLRQILDESLACFAEQGFERATYDDLIRRSNISRGSFYWYFPSKEALYEAVLDDCIEGYADRLEAEYARTDPADPAAKRLFDASLADFRAHRPRYRLLLRAPPSEGSHAKLVRWNDETQGFMRAKLEGDGGAPAGEAALLADVLSAFIDGVCVRAVLEDDGDLAILGRRIGRFLAGVAPRRR